MATGPFARWSRRAAAPGAVLVGDAADFFDPFTGQGIYSALRGAELAAECLIPALATSTREPVTAEPRVEAVDVGQRRLAIGTRHRRVEMLEHVLGSLHVGLLPAQQRALGREARAEADHHAPLAGHR